MKQHRNNMNESIAKNTRGCPEPEANHPSAPRILCADDEQAICACYFGALLHSGYSVTTVANGKLAWEALENETFDLLITDNQMPCLTGEELVLKVRQHGLKLPIIFASSQLDVFLDPANEWLQVDQLLQRPFSLPKLINTVERVLHRHH
jgi:two-component system alkaline phosphatase synthesis response regulator PhoP